ncbi:hypothetical protein Ocin01_20061 [Orchesella cincta]|uniref:Uncharacterized protein n=1 Tax=Orchesella cincta TaxID=48709 RepID=A0A1D2M0Y4_ORCCI|nr:hypothetical protein Ocin01_20061 [Orchesella cincta]
MTSFWGILPILFLWTFLSFKQAECQLGVTYTPFNITKQTKPVIAAPASSTQQPLLKSTKSRKSLALTVYQGLYRHSPPANSSQKLSSAGSTDFLTWRKPQSSFSELDLQLKFGVRISNCETTIGKPDNYHKNKELLTLFDFLICEFMPKESSYSEGPEAFFEELKQEVKKVDHAIKEMSNGIHVIVETGWANAEMKMFWEKMGQWANKEKRLVSMSEAFDNPWKMEVKDVPFAAHYGIWKHLETEDNSKKAYERKVPQINTHNPLKPKPTAPSGRGGTKKPQKNAGSGNRMTSRLSVCVILSTTFVLGGFLSYS